MKTKINYSDYFKTGIRQDQKSYDYLGDNAPEELKDLVQSIHFDCFRTCLPSDWVYSAIMEAFEDLEETCLDECQIQTDNYAKELIEWLKEPNSIEFCEEAIREGLSGKDFMGIIDCGQWLAKKIVYEKVNEFLEKKENQ